MAASSRWQADVVDLDHRAQQGPFRLKHTHGRSEQTMIDEPIEGDGISLYSLGMILGRLIICPFRSL